MALGIVKGECCHAGGPPVAGAAAALAARRLGDGGSALTDGCPMLADMPPRNAAGRSASASGQPPPPATAAGSLSLADRFRPAAKRMRCSAGSDACHCGFGDAEGARPVAALLGAAKSSLRAEEAAARFSFERLCLEALAAAPAVAQGRSIPAGFTRVA